MIDLHMHTKYSDGDFTLRELIEKLNEEKIEYASVTDHNSLDAHIEFERDNYNKLYNGKMIKGVELQALVGEFLIEVLVYDYDLYEFKKFIDKTKENFWTFHLNAYKELLNIADKIGLKYIEPKKEIQPGYYSNMKFQDAIKSCYEDNIKIVSDKILSDSVYFYRHEFQNVNSPFYVDNKSAFPKLEEIIKEAHKCHGKVFLAHIDEYKIIENKLDFLKLLKNNYEIDGIEVYHPSINDKKRIEYMNIAKKYNWLISAGSDFHGPHLEHRKNINTSATLEEISWIK